VPRQNILRSDAFRPRAVAAIHVEANPAISVMPVIERRAGVAIDPPSAPKAAS